MRLQVLKLGVVVGWVSWELVCTSIPRSLTFAGMGDVGGIPEDAYDDMITDENERRKLQGYNINKEMKINTTKMSRSVILPA